MLTKRKREEDGAVVPFVAVIVVLLVTIAAFAVDLGMQRVARRDMQALADVVALDLVRYLDGRTVSEIASSTPTLESVADSIIARQKGMVGEAPTISIKVGRVVSDGSFEEFTLPDQIPNAVQVLAETEVSFAFNPGSGRAARNATAVGVPTTCYSTATYAARVNTGDSSLLSPLSDLFNLQLTVLDIEGLADSTIELSDLIAELGIATFDEMLEAELELRNVTLAYARALAKQSGRTAEVALLERVAQSVDSLGLRLEEVLDLDTGLASGLQGTVNVLDLLALSVSAASGDSVLALPAVATGVPGISALTGSVRVGARPSIACGRPNFVRAETAQATVNLSGNFVNLNLGAARVSAPLTIELKIAPGAAEAVGLQCPRTDRMIDFLLEEGLATVAIQVGDPNDPNALQVQVTNLLGASVTVANGSLRFDGTQPEGSTPGGILVTDGNYEESPVLLTGTNSLSFPTLSLSGGLTVLPGLVVGNLVTSLLGSIQSGVINPLIQNVINPLANNLDTILGPALDAQGIKVSGGEVRAIPSSTCGAPRLVR